MQWKLTLPKEEDSGQSANILSQGGKHMRKIIFLLILISYLPAQAAWQTIETSNFLVHFPQKEYSLACQVAKQAEEIHHLLIPFYKTFSREKTELVLNTQTDIFNGSATPFPRNRVVLDLATIPAPGGISNSITYLLIHEYTHILQLDQNHGRASLVRDLFGKAPSYITLPGAFAPLWFVEGYAVYQESKHTTGGRAGGAEYRALILAEIAADRFFTPDKLEGFFARETWPSLQNYAYIYGAEFVSYLVRIYGEEKLAELVWDLGEIHVDFNLAFAKVYSSSLDAIWQEWKHSFRLPPKQEHVVLTESGGKTIWPQWASGKLYYLTSQGRYVPSLRVQSAGQDRQLLFGQLDSAAVPSADGRFLVYAKADYFDPDSIYTDLYLYDLSAQKERRLTRGLRATDPSWGKNGTIYYIRREGLSTALEAIEPSGNQKVILPAQTGVRYATPTLSPAGDKLALIVWREGGFQDLALLELRTGKLKYLTEDRHLESAPSWWGKWLLYTSDLAGVEQIYATDLLGRHLQVTNLATGAGQPAPHGAELTFVSLSGRGYDLATMPLSESSWSPVWRKKETYTQPTRSVGSYSPLAYNPLRSASPRWWWPKADLGWDVFTEGLVMENFRGFDTGGSDALGTLSWSLSGLWEFYPSFAAGAAFSLYNKLGFAETMIQTQLFTTGEAGYGFAGQYPLIKRLNRSLNLTGQLAKLPQSSEATLGLAFSSLSGRNRRYDIFQGSASFGYLRKENDESPLAKGAVAWQGRWLDGFRLNIAAQGFASHIPGATRLPVKGFEDELGANMAKIRGELERNLITIHRGHYLPVDSLKGRIYLDLGSVWEQSPQWRQSFGAELGLATGLGELVLGVAFPKGREKMIYFELRGL